MLIRRMFVVFVTQPLRRPAMTRQLRFILYTFPAVLFMGIVLVAAAPAAAESSRVVAVEEHWELQLGQPDADRSAPQTTMVISPTGDLTGTHFLFTLNHSTVPNYQPGGMQVQAWNGE